MCTLQWRASWARVSLKPNLLGLALSMWTAAQVGVCTPSARCHPEHNQTRASVIDIYAINLSLGAMALCTGVPRVSHRHAVDVTLAACMAVHPLFSFLCQKTTLSLTLQGQCSLVRKFTWGWGTCCWARACRKALGLALDDWSCVAVKCVRALCSTIKKGLPIWAVALQLCRQGMLDQDKGLPHMLLC